MSTDDQENLRQRIGDAAVIRDAFEAVPSPMAAAEGPEHTIVAANAACRVLAHQPDLIGKPAWQAFPGFPRQQIASLLDLVYATGEPFSAQGWQVQGDRYLDFTLTPWLGPGGMRGVLVTQFDVTDEVRERSVERQSPMPGERSRVWRETVAVQEAMLSSELPVLPQVRIAARYLPADGESSGGAWFDAFRRPDGRIALMVGDVAEHGAGPLGAGAALIPAPAAPPDPPAGVTPAFMSAVLAPGEVLLMYSDGLVVRPGRTLDDGMT